MQVTSEQIKRIEVSIIFSFVGLYVWLVANHLWAPLCPGDPYDYALPAYLHSHFGNEPNLLFLIMPTIGVGLMSSYMPAYIATPAYTLFVHAAILSAGALWLRGEKGLLAAIAFALFFSVNDMFLNEGTYIRNTQTELLFMMLAVVTFFWDGGSESFKTFKRWTFLPELFKSRFFYTGVFCACAVFSKPSAIAVIGLLSLQIAINKNWDRGLVFRQCVLGGLVGILGIFVLYMLLVSPETLWYSITFFFNPEHPGWSPKSGHVWAITNMMPVETERLLSVPVMSCLVFAPRAYIRSESRAFFLLVYLYVLALYLIWYFSGIVGTSPHDHVSLFTFSAMGLSAMLGDVFNGARAIRIKVFEKTPFLRFLRFLLGIFLLFYLGYAVLKGLSVITVYFYDYFRALLDNDLFFNPNAKVSWLPALVPGLAIAMIATTLLYRLDDPSKPVWFEVVKTPKLLPILLGIVLWFLACYGVGIGIGSNNDLIDRTIGEANRSIVSYFSLTASLLVLSQFLSSRILVVLLLVGTILMPPTIIRGSVKIITERNQLGNLLYYEGPFVFNHAPPKFGYYIKKWMLADPVSDFGNLLGTYRLFFDKKHPPVRRIPGRPTDFPRQFPDSTLCGITEEKGISLLSGSCGDHIVTDDIATIRKYFPDAKLVDAFVSPRLNEYYVMEIRGKE